MRRLDRQSDAFPVGRRGTILVFAMLALLLTSMLSAALMKSAFMSLQQIEREQVRVQATWLADSGCQRALLRLKKEADYSGEEWKIPAEQLRSGAATVRITVAADPNSADRRILTATAEYPVESPAPVRISKRLVVGAK